MIRISILLMCLSCALLTGCGAKDTLRIPTREILRPPVLPPDREGTRILVGPNYHQRGDSVNVEVETFSVLGLSGAEGSDAYSLFPPYWQHLLVRNISTEDSVFTSTGTNLLLLTGFADLGFEVEDGKFELVLQPEVGLHLKQPLSSRLWFEARPTAGLRFEHESYEFALESLVGWQWGRRTAVTAGTQLSVEGLLGSDYIFKDGAKTAYRAYWPIRLIVSPDNDRYSYVVSFVPGHDSIRHTQASLLLGLYFY